MFVLSLMPSLVRRTDASNFRVRGVGEGKDHPTPLPGSLSHSWTVLPLPSKPFPPSPFLPPSPTVLWPLKIFKYTEYLMKEENPPNLT